MKYWVDAHTRTLNSALATISLNLDLGIFSDLPSSVWGMAVSRVQVRSGGATGGQTYPPGHSWSVRRPEHSGSGFSITNKICAFAAYL